MARMTVRFAYSKLDINETLFGVIVTYVERAGVKQLALTSLVGSTHRTLNTCSTHCIIIHNHRHAYTYDCDLYT